MSILKCTICGKENKVTENTSVFKCENCGNSQSIEETTVTVNPVVENALKRGFMFLEDSEWEDADKYFEKVLDEDPENANAYLGKLLVNMKIRSVGILSKCGKDFSDNSFYKKAIRFGDIEFNSKLENCCKNSIYISAIKIMENAKSVDDYKNAIALFERIADFSDSKQRIVMCEEKLSALDTEKRLIAEKAKRAKKKRNAIIIGLSSAAMLVGLVVASFTVIMPNVKYNNAVELYQNGDYERAVVAFEKMKGYKDSDENIIKSKYGIAQNFHKDGMYAEAIAAFDELTTYENINEIVGENVEEAKINSKYGYAISFYDEGNYVEAISLLDELGDYKESKEYIKNSLSFIRETVVSDVLLTYRNTTVALKTDGTVIAIGDKVNEEYDVSNWKDISSIHYGDEAILGVKSDGTVIISGSGSEYDDDEKKRIASWRNIVDLNYKFGVKSDGTVVSYDDWYDEYLATDDMKNVAYTVGDFAVKKDGSISVILSDFELNHPVYEDAADWISGEDIEVMGWKDIVQLSGYTGLKSDGTLNLLRKTVGGYQPDVSDWKNIIYFDRGDNYIFGLKYDGTVVVEAEFPNNPMFQVSDWTDIIAISASDGYTVGLKSDGTLVAVGDNRYGRCDVSDISGVKTTK